RDPLPAIPPPARERSLLGRRFHRLGRRAPRPPALRRPRAAAHPRRRLLRSRRPAHHPPPGRRRARPRPRRLLLLPLLVRRPPAARDAGRALPACARSRFRLLSLVGQRALVAPPRRTGAPAAVATDPAPVARGLGGALRLAGPRVLRSARAAHRRAAGVLDLPSRSDRAGHARRLARAGARDRPCRAVPRRHRAVRAAAARRLRRAVSLPAVLRAAVARR